MRRRAGIASITFLLAIMVAPGLASAHGPIGYVPFGTAKLKLARFTESLCLHGIPCKHRIRHCNRWAPNQVSCQSEILFWQSKDEATYCHWQGLVEQAHPSSRLEVWAEPKPTCKSMRGSHHWPSRPRVG
jgi:hypothetical protein